MSKLLIDIWKGMSVKSDKGDLHSYLPVYEELFAPYRESEYPILEIGLFNGASLKLWEQYFLNGKEVYGVDASETPHDGMADLRPMIEENIHNIYILDASNREQVEQTFHKFCKFSIILEDAGHDLKQQIDIYNIWKQYVYVGGIYVIEDIQDIDSTREMFENIDSDKNVQILDRRNISGRYDDVLVVITDKK